jgi:hypothetical protein
MAAEMTTSIVTKSFAGITAAFIAGSAPACCAADHSVAVGLGGTTSRADDAARVGRLSPRAWRCGVTR